MNVWTAQLPITIINKLINLVKMFTKQTEPIARHTKQIGSADWVKMMEQGSHHKHKKETCKRLIEELRNLCETLDQKSYHGDKFKTMDDISKMKRLLPKIKVVKDKLMLPAVYDEYSKQDFRDNQVYK